eukprot:364651-Chlamydomonas_euryale.AAC.6
MGCSPWTGPCIDTGARQGHCWPPPAGHEQLATVCWARAACLLLLDTSSLPLAAGREQLATGCWTRAACLCLLEMSSLPLAARHEQLGSACWTRAAGP